MESALHAWILAATGLAEDRIRWAKQGQTIPRPTSPGPFAVLRELGREAGGADWGSLTRTPLTFADLAIASVSAATDRLTVTAHGLQTGDGPVRLETTGTAPGGLAVDTDYWAIRVDANTLQLAATFLAAIETPAPVNITGAGTGAHMLVATDDTVRAGAELTATTNGTRTATVEVSYFGGAATGDTSAVTMLSRAHAALALPSLRETMRAAGAVVASTEPIRDVSAVIAGATFEPRAVLTARIHVAAPRLTESLSVIESAEATGTAS